MDGERGMGCGEDMLIRASRGAGDFDAANADGDQSADLKEFTANGATGRLGELRGSERQTANAFDQDIGHRRHP